LRIMYLEWRCQQAVPSKGSAGSSGRLAHRAETPGNAPAKRSERAKHIQSVDDTRQVTQDGQQDVDEQVRTASPLQEDTQRRQDDGKDDLADVAAEREGALVSC